MADPSHRGQRLLRQSSGWRARFGALLALAPLVVGCGLLPAGQGNPAEPVLVTGRVLDAEGRPFGGARLDHQVNDYRAAINAGDVVPVVFHQTFSTNPDGTFELHLAPTQELLAFGSKEGGSVNFNLYALLGTGVAPWAFPRELVNGTWGGEPPFVELRPIGSMLEPPGVPAPEPAAT